MSWNGTDTDFEPKFRPISITQQQCFLHITKKALELMRPLAWTKPKTDMIMFFVEYPVLRLLLLLLLQKGNLADKVAARATALRIHGLT